MELGFKPRSLIPKPMTLSTYDYSFLLNSYHVPLISFRSWKVGEKQKYTNTKQKQKQASLNTFNYARQYRVSLKIIQRQKKITDKQFCIPQMGFATYAQWCSNKF